MTFAATVLAASDRSGAAPGHRPSWGHGWRRPRWHRSGSGAACPDAPGELVIDPRLAASAGLQVGQTARVQTAGGVAAYTVVGITSRALVDQASLFFGPDRAHARGPPGPGVRRRPAPRPQSRTSPGLRQPSPAATCGRRDRTRVRWSSPGGPGKDDVDQPVRSARRDVAARCAARGERHVRPVDRPAAARARAAPGGRSHPATVRRMIGREAVVIAVIAGLPGPPSASPWRPGCARGSWPSTPSRGGCPCGRPGTRRGRRGGGRRLAAARVAGPAASDPADPGPTEAAVEPTRPARSDWPRWTLAAAVYLYCWPSWPAPHGPGGGPVTLLCAVVAAIAVALLGPVIVRVSSELVGPPLERAFRRTGFVAMPTTARTPADSPPSSLRSLWASRSPATILFSHHDSARSHGSNGTPGPAPMRWSSRPDGGCPPTSSRPRVLPLA